MKASQIKARQAMIIQHLQWAEDDLFTLAQIGQMPSALAAELTEKSQSAMGLRSECVNLLKRIDLDVVAEE